MTIRPSTTYSHYKATRSSRITDVAGSSNIMLCVVEVSSMLHQNSISETTNIQQPYYPASLPSRDVSMQNRSASSGYLGMRMVLL